MDFYVDGLQIIARERQNIALKGYTARLLFSLKVLDLLKNMMRWGVLFYLKDQSYKYLTLFTLPGPPELDATFRAE